MWIVKRDNEYCAYLCTPGRTSTWSNKQGNARRFHSAARARKAAVRIKRYEYQATARAVRLVPKKGRAA